MTLNTDVLVLGAGMAGYAAALSAADEGAEVLIVEKAAKAGGSAILSGGTFAFAGTDMQEAEGVDDSVERLKEDLLIAGQYKNDEELVDLYCANQLDTYYWLSSLGVNFKSLSLSGAMSVPRAHTPSMVDTFATLSELVAQHPKIRVLWNSPARRLLTESDAGCQAGGPRVRGAVIDSEGGEQQILARSGVVIATGGYSRDPELIRAFSPLAESARVISAEGSQGDGIRLGMSVGAGLADLAALVPAYGGAVGGEYGPEKGRFLHMMYRGGIIVDPEGKRFVDESRSYKFLGKTFLEKGDHVSFQIFDEPIMAQGIRGKMNNDFQGAFEEGYLQTADSIPELAAKIGVDPNALKETVDRYNDNVRAGSDPDFGRASLGNGSGTPVTIEQAPFYAFPSTVTMGGTSGGLTVSTSMQVRNVFGESIPGLFAAGEAIGGFHGAGYMSGTHLGKASTFGRIAGRSAAAGSAA